VLIHQMLEYMPQSITDIELVRLPVNTKGLHVAVSRDHPRGAKILTDFNREIAAMKADGSLQRIVDTQIERILDTGLLTQEQLEEFRRW
jgi:ABC-type amino acid transport substrate-binding protein